jgi:hypothetical protein
MIFPKFTCFGKFMKSYLAASIVIAWASDLPKLAIHSENRRVCRLLSSFILKKIKFNVDNVGGQEGR